MHAIASLSPPDLPTWASSRLPSRRLKPLLVIVGAHLLLVWALMHRDAVMVVLRQPASPLNVMLLTEAAPPPPTIAMPPRPAQPPPPSPAWLPPPEVTVATAAPAPPAAYAAPTPTAVVVATAPVVAEAPTAAPARTPEVVAPTPPAPRQWPASAIRYRVPPAIEVPMASRRLGESGTVWLQVLVDAQGQPRQVSLHRSSGYPRLDEQALAAMRQARFQPLIEGGSTVEWRVIAPLLYELD